MSAGWFKRRAAAAALAAAATGCDLAPVADADPAAWDPAAIDSGEPGDAGKEAPGPGCDVEPDFDDALTASTATTPSHLAGQPCLEGCHEAGGAARKIFAAAGTVYRSQRSRSVAHAGEVHGVGGTTLIVDRCGNFYAVDGALTLDPTRTQPFVQNPTLHRMDKSLYRVPRAGSCNQASCHDFSSRLRWGVYF